MKNMCGQELLTDLGILAWLFFWTTEDREIHPSAEIPFEGHANNTIE